MQAASTQPRALRWHGVFAAVTTPFASDLSLDAEAFAAHVAWLASCGCSGIVPLGSLGEANTLAFDEKVRLLEIARRALPPATPVVAGIAALGTAEACALARAAETCGAAGLMVLPPYVYRGDASETQAHFDAVLEATGLPCMLYNNPPAYGTDVTPEQIAALAARHPNLAAVKESSGDIRRVTALRALLGERLALFVGVDDLIVEGVAAGACGWIAGLVNAFPRESVALFEYAEHGDAAAAAQLYAWFLPLLRLDVGPKFVQAIKLAQALTGHGNERVRPPRLVLSGAERETVAAIVRACVTSVPIATG
jgi:1-pyrroline-4-hydroxy-2-carboxylate deaminase